MTNPRVSIIMPVYNVEAYVAEAIDSVLAQTFREWELIIVDDGGSDSSIDICSRYNDPRVRVVSQTNRGLAGARNTGILNSRGDYIALLDADDRWVPEKLVLHVIHLDSSPQVGVSFAGSYMIDAEGNRLAQAQRPKTEAVSAHRILCRNPVGNGSAAVIRRATLEQIAFAHPDEPLRTCFFDESFRQSEDIELWVRISLQTSYRFDGIDQLLTEYRIVAGGLSANVARQFETWERMVAKTKSYAPEFIARHGAKARAYQLRYLARRSVQMGDGAFALVLMRESLQASISPLLEEPRKSLETLAAAIVARFVNPKCVTWLAAHWTRARVVA
jgi:glycosyltransferase involved in cell wall biosynthesis